LSDPWIHVPDEELVSAMDAEVGEPRLSRIRHHLAHCEECRIRFDELKRAASEFLAVRAAISEGSLPSEAAPAARLRAALSREERTGWSFRGTPDLFPRFRFSTALGALAALLAPAATLVWFNNARVDAAGPLPDSRLTPGTARPISRQQVCLLPAEDEGKLVPYGLALEVFEQYGIAKPEPGTYEVDYLISPALGGTTSIQNLWPLPYGEGEWTSRLKDALEDRLRTLVCDGALDLETAQRDIATNWIAAYQKYFRSKRPISAHAHFVKDSPWE
jgi:hypothetical protein